MFCLKLLQFFMFNIQLQGIFKVVRCCLVLMLLISLPVKAGPLSNVQRRSTDENNTGRNINVPQNDQPRPNSLETESDYDYDDDNYNSKLNTEDQLNMDITSSILLGNMYNTTFASMPGATRVDVLGAILKSRIDRLRDVQNGQLELVFLVDSSASVGKANFFNELKFVKKVLADFVVSYWSTRVAVITFASRSRVLNVTDQISFPTVENHKCSLFTEELPNITYVGGGTYTKGAFENAYSILKKARNEATKAVFLITDGYSNGGDPRSVAKKLRDRGVEIFTFGISNGNIRELFEMSSEPKHEHCYILQDFEEFESLARRALYEDLMTGDYIKVNNKKCVTNCEEREDCCDSEAICKCGTIGGQYECVCPAGYFGTGLKGGCQACPTNTYKSEPSPGGIGTCVPCPQPYRSSPIASTSIIDCKCDEGYAEDLSGRCVAIRCPSLLPPEHGSFINECSNQIHSACAVTCEIGYRITGGANLVLCTPKGTWNQQIPDCQLKKCEMFPTPENSEIQCSREDYAFDTVCNTTCDQGYKLLGSVSRVCLPIAKWDGLNPICKPVTCKPKLKSPLGSFSPASCTKERNSIGQECVFSCNQGYEVIGNPSYRCLDSGQWDRKFDLLNPCRDITSPDITCPHDIYLEAQLHTNKAEVSQRRWRVPRASDNSNNVTISVLYRTLPPYIFTIGKNNITYEARDRAGNTAHCSFIVYVKDIERPIVVKCGSPPPILSPKPMTSITWKEPKFSDNSGLKPEIVSSHRPGDQFPWGTTVVKYRAADHSGNTKTCDIIIEVQESACKVPQSPYAGHTDCNQHGQTLNCTIACKDGFSFAITPHPVYSCSPDGVWSPEDSMPWPDCSEYKYIKSVQLPVKVKYSLSKCNEESIEQIRDKISTSIDVQLNKLCGQRYKCIVSYIEANCKDQDDSHFVRKRSVEQEDENVRTFDQNLNIHNTNVSQLEPEVIVEIIINANQATSFTSDSEIGESDEFQNLANALDSIKTLLNFEITADVLNVTQGSGQATFEHVKGTCPEGTVLKEGNKCVNCAKGTYYKNGKCVKCQIGTYQTVEGSMECQECPTNSSTLYKRSKNQDDCKDICPPGTCSNTGLEQCESCGQGSYQPNANSTDCQPCPYNTTTASTGAVSHLNCISQCQPGFVSDTGLSPCYPCPEGYYQSEVGQQYCDKCPAGSTTGSVGSQLLEDCNVEKQVAQKPNINVVPRIVFNECFKQPCKHDGTCQKNDGGYVCLCRSGFEGAHCQVDVNECDGVVCMNNGTCHDGIDVFNCTCEPGYQGVLCDEDINECQSNPCQNQGRCTDDINNYYCDCPEAYTGLNCEIEVNECLSSPCANSGRCSDEIGGFRCLCPDGYFGDRCGLEINECDSTPCEYGGTCINQVNGFSCTCLNGLEGDRCEINTNDCQHEPCVRGATCQDLINDFKCLCRPGYGGKVCDIELPSNFSLSFEYTGTTDYILLDGIPDLHAITVAFWMRTSDTENWGTAISYTVDQDSFDDLVLMDYTGWVIKVRNTTVITDLQTNDGIWHHMALTWSSIGGEWHLYSDGDEVIQQLTVPLAVNDIIPGGGVFVIGQEQDTLGGGFSSREAFIGNISHLNVWDYAFSAREIASLSKTCEQARGNVRGNVIAWPDVKKGMYGRVKSIPNNFCSGCPKPVEIDHGSVSGYLPSTALQTITYSCNAGYIMVGIPEASCKVYGDWLFQKLPRCSKKFCGHPGFIDDGDFIGDNFDFNDTIKYQCYDGFKLDGADTRRCSEDGEWDIPPPQCLEILCNKVPTISNGQVNFISQTQNRQGSTFNVSCNQHYMLEGQNTVSCQRNGHWSRMPRCRPLTCKPSVISNGYRKQNTDPVKIGDHVTYFCDREFELIGEPVLTCEADLRFNGSVPHCRRIRCSSVPTVPNSEYSPIKAEYLFHHIVQYTCIQGFNIEDVAVLSCVAMDTWDNDPPHCVPLTCLPPEEIEHGHIIGSDFSFQHSITYECNSGYRITENVHRSCLANGTWSNTMPRCTPIECPPPRQQNYMNIVGNSFQYNDIILFTCQEGYWLDGESTIQCGAEKQWNATIPTCRIIDCGKPPMPPDRVAHYITGHTYGSQMNYFCKEGYRPLKTGTVFTCGSNGAWIGELPSCKIVSCLRPIIPIHGFMNGQNFTYGSTVTFSCEDRYLMNGNSTITCGANGKWSSNVPVCLAMCDKPVFPPNTIITSQGGVFTLNSTLTLSCDRGKKIVGLSTITCLKDGSWSGEPGKCIDIVCSSPNIPNGVPDALDFRENQTLLFHCLDGYQIVDGNKFVCTHSGKWQGIMPSCKLISCPNITNFPNGQFIAASFKYGSEVNFSCNAGYQLIGAEQIICRSNGVWNPLIPICVKVSCPDLQILKNGLIRNNDNTFGSVAIFSCIQGFKLEGSNELRCLENSQWSGEQPICVAVTCGQPMVLENGDFTVNGNVSYYCLPGFTLIGNSISTCQNDGTWSVGPRSCKPNTCSRPDNFPNGYYTPAKRSYLFTDQLVYTCNQGYTLQGNRQQICGWNGKWSGGRVLCRRSSCPQPTAPSNGFVRVEVLPNGSKHSHYSCQENYTLVGESSSMCSSQRWSSAQPQCRLIDCSLPPKPKNVVAIRNGTTFRSVVTYSCKIGYRFEGKKKKVCLESSNWSRGHVRCIKITCPRLDAPENGGVSDHLLTVNSLARYHCLNGYDLIGHSKRTCSKNGVWTEAAPTCKPVTCPIPREIEHGRIRYDEVTYTSVTHYECNEGFSIHGDKSTRCSSSGRWKPLPPTCEIISCGVPDKPTHSVINYADGTYQDVVTYMCDIGYNLDGPTERTCLIDETWSDSAPVCSSVKCPPPPLFTNASPANTKSDYSFGDIINFVCSPGFKPQGNTMICQANGTWNFTINPCIAIECPFPLVLHDKHLTVSGLNHSVGAVIEFSCKNNFQIHGPTSLTCNSNGAWNGSIPVCKPLTCPPLNLTDGEVTILENENGHRTVIFRCNSGFEINGVESSTCIADGTWDNPKPQCVKTSGCGPAPDIQNGNYRLGVSPRGHQTAFYTCTNGYVMKHYRSQMYCNINNQWQGHLPQCVPLHAIYYPRTPICTQHCRNGGICVGYNVCQCPAGFTGERCHTTVHN